MIKVLQINMGETFGGIEKLELEWLRNIQGNITLDFLNPINVFENYKDEIKSLNGKTFDFNIERNNLITKTKYAHKLRKFLKENKYDVVHINSSAFFFSLQVVSIAKRSKIRKIIVHSHSVPKIKIIKRIFKKFLTPIYLKKVDCCLACSQNAKYSLFTKDFINRDKIKILKNGVDINTYKFDEKKRIENIKKYNLSGKTVYGNVGRFENVKNHEFLIDIFNEIFKIKKDSILILVGDGNNKEKIKDKVTKLGLDNNVIFMNYIENVNEILNCLDVFIFPSLHEGLGRAGIEAQTNGLITYCSNGIPEDANISPFFRRFDLNEKPQDIAKRICGEVIEYEKRKDAYKYVIENGYDIKDVCKELEKIYTSKS